MDLMNFGMSILEYANEKNCYKNFIKKFNEYFELPLDNNTATQNELIIYSFSSSKKQYKEWAKNELINMLNVRENVERESLDLSSLIPNTITDNNLEQIING